MKIQLLSKVLGLLLAAIIPLTFPSKATATTMISMNIAQLSENAQKAFVTRIQSVETSETQGRPCDVVTGLVTDAVFGDVETSEVITWRQFKLGNAIALPGMPQYKVGTEYLIFLSGPGTGMGFQAPVGMGQGAFAVMRNPATGTAIARNAFMNATLASGLDIQKAATDMVASDARSRNLTGKARQQEVQRQMVLLKGGRNAPLESLKDTARFFKTQQSKGRSFMNDYRTTAGALTRGGLISH